MWGRWQFVQHAEWPGLVDVKGAHISKRLPGPGIMSTLHGLPPLAPSAGGVQHHLAKAEVDPHVYPAVAPRDPQPLSGHFLLLPEPQLDCGALDHSDLDCFPFYSLLQMGTMV